MPAGTIFGQATGSAHQFSTGLFRMTAAHPEGEDDDRSVQCDELTPYDDGQHLGAQWIYEGAIFQEHRFLVYEPTDLDRLARLIGRGPGTSGPSRSRRSDR
jgi:hypothetical protein